MKTFLRMLLPALVCLSVQAPAHADTLAKVQHKGRMVIGTRDASAPLAYALGHGRYAGYHIDICDAIVKAVKKEVGLPSLAADYMTVTPQSRVPLVMSGAVDLECGSTTNNVARQRDVAFAPTTYVANVRMMVKASSDLASVHDLGGKTVVTTAGTTSVMLLRNRDERRTDEPAGAGVLCRQMVDQDRR